jgi:hypothetical protein
MRGPRGRHLRMTWSWAEPMLAVAVGNPAPTTDRPIHEE